LLVTPDNRKRYDGKISVYSGSLTLPVFVKQMDRLRKVFGKISKEWTDTLLERLKIHLFTDEKLIDAVDNVIDTFEYGERPNIAKIILYDKTIELLTYYQLIKLGKDTSIGEVFNNYALVEVNQKPYYTPKDNVKTYKMKLWNTDKPKSAVKIKKAEKVTEEEARKTAEEIRKVIKEISASVQVKKVKPKYGENYKSSKSYQRAKAEFEAELKKQNTD